MEIDGMVKDLLPEIIEIRRKIHKNPELGFEEFKTSALVKKCLNEMGIEFQDGISINKTGICATLGNGNGPAILLRADMDALPLKEGTGLPYASEVDGKMHACGHDVHTSILLGVAKVLSRMRDNIKGTIKFVFQPAEEASPIGGASGMIEEGVLDNPKVDYALALHVWPQLETGQVGYAIGPASAESNKLEIDIEGRGSHASAPHMGIDAITAAARVIESLQTIVSREIDPLKSVVITIGTIKGGERYNIICSSVHMEGTVRILNPELSDVMPHLIERSVRGAAESAGAKYEIRYIKGYPQVINDEELTFRVVDSLKRVNGMKMVNILPDLGGEDFAFISRRVPSTYLKLGCRRPGQEIVPLHNNRVIIDEDCIEFGIKALVYATLNLLGDNNGYR